MSNIQITQTETPNIVVTVDRGVAGVGIESVAIVYQDPLYYLEFTYTNGTTELVPLPVVATGVTSFNTRIGAVTLTSNDVTTALLANSIANSKLVNSSITVNGAVISLGGSVNVGTVTSVAATAGTGISVTGSPITTSGTLVVTNTAPDQVVSLTGAGTTSVSGTYPNFTITSNDSASGTVTSVGGTGTVNGITLTGSVTTSGNLTLGGTLSGVNLATQVTGTLPPANGGTGITSLGAGVATFLGTPTSANLAAAVTNETGTGALVFGTSPTLTTPTITGGTVNPTTLQENGSPVVVQTDIGTAPNEIPLNQYLGSMAYQDRTAVNIGGGVATLGTATVTSIQNDTAISNVEPSLMLNFAAVEALDPRITYTRASTATYYNGVTTAVAEQNLQIYSQEFDNASWTKENGTVTANSIVTTAPDGTNTADLFTENTATSTHGLVASASSIANQPMVFSAFIKPNGRTVIRLDWLANDGFYVLATLTGSGTINNGTGTVTALANGWYRLALVITPTVAASGFRIRMCESVGGGLGVTNYTGDGTSGIYVWGAQLEQRSAVSAYTPTTTQAITNYIPVLLTAASGVPRFDHNPISGDSLGFLVEQQSTNLLLQSQTFDSASWQKFFGATITANTVIAPDGTLTGDKMVEGTGTVTPHILQGVSITATTYTFTVFAKPAGNDYMWFRVDALSFNRWAFINIANGTLGTVDAGLTVSVVDVGNGWYRCVLTYTATTSGLGTFYIGTSKTNSLTGYTGDGYSGIYIWGAQLEAAAFPTSYIATVASQVTRAADAASMTGTNFSSWFNNAEGTLYGETTGYTVGNVIIGTMSDGTANNAILLSTITVNGRLFVRRNTTIEADIATSAITNSAKLVGAYKTNDCAATANGTTPNADLSVLLPILDRFTIGRNTVGNETGNQTIKKLAYYPRRLSNEELQEMTS